MPNVLGSEIDKLVRLREKRMAAQRKADDLKRQENRLSDQLTELLIKQKIEKASGKLGTFSVKNEAFPKVTDWDAFYRYISQRDAFELLQKRVGVGSWREYYEAGDLPAGTEVESIWKHTLTAKR